MAVLQQAALNQSTWSTTAAQRDLDRVRLFTDPGEQAALDLVRAESRGRPILDIGVGTGRTVPMLEPLTDDYRALDLSPAMVAVSRARYPHARIDEGDARTLSAYPTAHFGLVNFSYSGIDSIPPSDRRLVLRAVRRVLAPRAVFLFSTLNIEGPSFRERPWRLRVWPTKNPLTFGRRVASQIVGIPLSAWNWIHLRGGGERGPGYAVAPLSAHHYRVLAHYTTMERQLEELAEEGFDREVVVLESRQGRRVSPGDDLTASDWFHLVARKPPS